MYTSLIIFGLLVLLAITLYKNNSWFQNLKKEDREKCLFHFRGKTGIWSYIQYYTERNGMTYGSREVKFPIRYELCSRFSCKLEIENDREDGGTMFVIAPLFFTAYITFPTLRMPKWLLSGDHQTGFYFYEWALVWNWNQWRMGSMPKPQPWYKKFYFHIDEFFVGKWETVTSKIFWASEKNVKFSFRDKEYVMDEILFESVTRFRTGIPMRWYKKKYIRCDLKIEDAPRYAGKGENSWDCGDNATHGSSFSWKPDGEGDELPDFHYTQREEILAYAIKRYCEGVHKNILRYGRASGDKGDRKLSVWHYIGQNKKASSGDSNGLRQ